MNNEDGNGIESRIIETARQIFLKKGFEATTMGDIASKVGISRTAMHYYFRTKDIMFGAILKQLIKNILPNLEALMNEDSTTLEKLPIIIDAYISVLAENPHLPFFIIVEMNRDPQHLFKLIFMQNELIGPFMKLQRQITEEMEKGLIRKMPLIDVVSTFVGSVVFPLLIQNGLTHLFTDGDSAKFSEYYLNRKPLVYEIMYSLLSIKK